MLRPSLAAMQLRPRVHTWWLPYSHARRAGLSDPDHPLLLLQADESVSPPGCLMGWIDA